MILGMPDTLEEMWRRFYEIAALTHPDSGGVAEEFEALMDSLPAELGRFPDAPLCPLFTAGSRPSLRDVFDVAFNQPSSSEPIGDLEGPAGIEETPAHALCCAASETFHIDPSRNYSEF
jgi:hypothetical protein